MTMHNLDLLPQDNVPKNREKRKNGWKSGLAVNDKEWDVIDLEPICEIPDSSSAFVGVGYNDDFVPTVD